MLLNLVLAAADGDAVNPMNPERWVAGTALVVAAFAFTILMWKVWPVITKGLDERNDKILNEIKAAEDARSQAKQALSDYEKSLADAREEATRTIAEARAEAQRLAAGAVGRRCVRPRPLQPRHLLADDRSGRDPAHGLHHARTLREPTYKLLNSELQRFDRNWH